MVLTKECISFARADSDIMVDKILIENMISVARVDIFEKKGSRNMGGILRFGMAPSKPMLSNPNSRSMQKLPTDSMESFMDGQRETFPFEIKALIGKVQRSYFVRVESELESDDWVRELNSALKSSKREHARQDSWLQRLQRDTQELCDDHVVSSP